jgi:hypothetical protein
VPACSAYHPKGHLSPSERNLPFPHQSELTFSPLCTYYTNGTAMILSQTWISLQRSELHFISLGLSSTWQAECLA